MNLKMLVGGVIAVVAIVTASYFIISPQAQQALEGDQNISDTPAKELTDEVEYVETDDEKVVEVDEGVIEEDATEPERTTTSAPAPTPVPTTPTQAPTLIQTTQPSGYTAAQVALHANSTSCWSIVNGKVYDLTAFISKHPGGEKRILNMCGKDASSAFSNQHMGEPKPEKMLASYYLGELTK